MPPVKRATGLSGLGVVALTGKAGGAAKATLQHRSRCAVAISDTFWEKILQAWWCIFCSRVALRSADPAVSFRGRRRYAIALVGAAWLCVLFSPFLVQPACSQELGDDGPAVSVEEIDQSVRAHIEQAHQFLVARQYTEAVEMLRGVMETHGERLVYLPDQADSPLRRYVPMRLWGQLQLMRWAVMAPAALQYYQTVVEQRAAQLWGQVERDGDERAWRELLDSYFLTVYGAQAAWRRGERLLERGETVRARGWWERLHPGMRTPVGVPELPAGRPLWLFVSTKDGQLPNWLAAGAPVSENSVFLAHVATPYSLADLRARAVLVSVLEGHRERAACERMVLEQQFPAAEGALAGQAGLWTELLKQLPEPRAAFSPSELLAWSTFAGTPHRNAAVPRAADPGGKVLWKIALPRISAGEDRVGQGRLRVGEVDDGILAYFPVVVGNTVWIVQSNGVRAVDLRSGTPAFDMSAAVNRRQENSGMVYEPPRFFLRPAVGQLPHWGVPRYTATTDGRSLWARLGSPITRGPVIADMPAEPSNWIVALDVQAQGRLLDGYPLEPPSGQWAFEGTPVTDGRRIYVALRKQNEIRAEAALAAYDASTARLLWLRSICTSDTPGQGRWNEITHNLLTLHQGMLYYNTNLGVVAAVEAESGRVEWVTRYPRVSFTTDSIDQDPGYFYRSLNPVAVYFDVLVVAPADSDRLFALDAFTGQTLWCTPPGVAGDAVHILGIFDGTLVVSGDYLYWFDVRTGRLRCQFPPPLWSRPGYARPSPRGYGRGVMTEDTILWPTHAALYLFKVQPQVVNDLEVPVPVGEPRSWSWFGIQPGNLIPAGDLLLVAGPTELAALRW